MLYTLEKFHNNILNSFNLQSGHEFITEMAMFKVQRAITQKVANQSYDLCVRENISDGFRVMEQIQMMPVLTDGRTLEISDGTT